MKTNGIYRYAVSRMVREVIGSNITLGSVREYDGYDEREAWKSFTDGELGFGESITMSVFVNVDDQDQLYRSYERTK